MSGLRSTVIHFAFVKTEFERTRDITRGLLPIFAAVLSKRANSLFSPQSFIKDLSSTFGIDMPILALDHFAPVLCEEGFLIKQNNNGHYGSSVYLIAEKTSESYSPEYEAVFNELIENFISFSEPKFVAAGITISRDKLGDEFCKGILHVEYLRSLHRHDNYRQSVPNQENKLSLAKEVRKNTFSTEQTATDFLIAKFISNTLKSQNTEQIEILINLAAGSLLAEVVLSLQEPPPTGRNLDSLVLVLDSPLVQDLLDLNAETRTDSISRLITDAQGLGVTLATYEHCIEELRANLTKAISNNRGQIRAERGIERRMLTDNTVLSRATAVLNHPTEQLDRIGITIIEVPPSHDLKNQKLFSDDNVGELASQLGNWDSVRNDAESIAETYRQRRRNAGKGSIFNCRFLFLTRNPRVSTNGTKYLVSNGFMSDYDSPIAMTDGHFAAMCWSLCGGIGDELPKLRLIAACSEALEPRRDVVEKMFEILARLDDDSALEFETLLTDERASVQLMDESLGCIEVIDGKNHAEVLEHIKASVVSELTDKHREELAEKESEVDEGDRKLKESNAHVLKLRMDSIETIRNCVDDSQKVASRVKRNLQLANLLVLVFAGIFDFYIAPRFLSNGLPFFEALTISVIIISISQFYKPLSERFIRFLENRQFQQNIRLISSTNFKSIDEAKEFLKGPAKE